MDYPSALVEIDELQLIPEPLVKRTAR
ncbi:uncharacterized protein METZ01_LOCUS93422 [marine metagenome]|uniref:Uncharacterized protein n=1 Tax=marine metagenome TaxID=408172 RepID=A0A381VLC3_9ZZZZ